MKIHLAGLAFLSLLTASCFEPPIDETVTLRFLPENAAIVTVTVQFAHPETFKNEPRARSRIEEARRSIEAGTDPWSRRFRAMGPPGRERIVWERVEGGLDRIIHRGWVEDFTSVSSFFSDTIVRVSLRAGEDSSELTIDPGHGDRATAQQRDIVRRETEEWSSRLADYYVTASALYAFLDGRPERARTCFGHLFQDLLDPGGRESLEPLTDPEKALIDPLKTAMEKVLDLFSVPKDRAYSLEELSRLVHDPFPAPLRVVVPGEVLEVEGLADDRKGGLIIPGRGLWEALVSAEGRWIAPEPVVAYYRQVSSRKPAPLDLNGFAVQPRRAARPPSAEEIRNRLQEELRPAPVYRVRWSTKNLPEAPDNWDWDDPDLQD